MIPRFTQDDNTKSKTKTARKRDQNIKERRAFTIINRVRIFFALNYKNWRKGGDG